MGRIIALALCVGLGGCAMAAKVDARQNYQQSLASYRACLGSQPARPCDREKALVDADEAAFNNMTAAMNPGSSSTSNILVRTR